VKTSLRGPIVLVVALSVALGVLVEVRPALTRVALETWGLLVAAGVGLLAWRLAWRGMGAEPDRRRAGPSTRSTPPGPSSAAGEVDRLFRRATAPEETSLRLALAARLERLAADLGLPPTETDPRPIRTDVPLDLDRLEAWLDQADAWVAGRRLPEVSFASRPARGAGGETDRSGRHRGRSDAGRADAGRADAGRSTREGQ